MQVKLNSRLEFPTHLNLKAYTKEGLWTPPPKVEAKDDKSSDGKSTSTASDGKAAAPEAKASEPPPEMKADEYYEYQLSGVLVHTGSADRGHYYSFVRERLTK